MRRRRLRHLLPGLALAAFLPAPAAPGPLARTEAVLFTPPSCGGIAPFTDVPASHGFCAWIRQLDQDEISTGCGGGKYCPDAPVTRDLAAMLVERAMRGTETWDRAAGVFARTRIVSPVPNDDEASGQRLLDALAAITDAASSKRYLLVLEPGTYDLAGAQFALKPYVSVHGAGVEQTKVLTSRNGAGTVGATGAALRRLTLSNPSSGAAPIGVDTNGSVLEDVEVIVSGGSATAIVTDVPLRRVKASARGFGSVGTVVGIEAASHNLLFEEVEASASNGAINYGLRVAARNLEVRDSHFRAWGGVVRNYAVFAEYTIDLPDDRGLVLRGVTAEVEADVATTAEMAALKAVSGRVMVEQGRYAAANDDDLEYALDCDGATGVEIEIHHAHLVGPTATVNADDADCVVRLGHSELLGGAVIDGAGDVRCVALWGDSYVSPGINSCF